MNRFTEFFLSFKWTLKAILQAVNRSRPRDWLRFWSDKRRYVAQGSGEEIVHFPIINEWTQQTPIDPVYYYQDAWAFERIFKFGPERHIDVGSHHKLVALLSKVVPTTMVDIRPLALSLDSLEFIEGSILALPFADQSLTSVSSICVVEHIGLGRYGDPIDCEGTRKAAKELIRVLRPGGRLFISVPVGNRDFVYYNAHRVFTEASVLQLFEPLRVIEKRYIYGNEFVNDLRSDTGTGCYEFERLS
ncbi:hypothetical protein Poly51_53660 [Rubripirellula tenax]|uniref:DUF268 domain-containing protein n=1 Tax=Rubripirellula tenax TaxID=2528015 RepID=A0A5C6EIT7_9BACT|nr:DUF268 domain-containing protein [Rubripirellula tenax]TWU47566.1 hypothetical protein Poly51_53660 [Rubripirellula tenax]